MALQKLFTSESVTEGHPDKLCDRISDSVLDAIIVQDPAARVACEVCATTGMVVVMGEITTTANINVADIARDAIRDIGYNDPACGIDYKSCAVLVSLDRQSPDIAMGVDASDEYKKSGTDSADLIGAGDQGMMFGFACDETPELMPAPIAYAHRLARRLTAVRKDGTLPYLRPDGKTQVTLAYAPDGSVSHATTVVVSTQHADSVSLETLREDIRREVILPGMPEGMLREDTQIFINPTGRFVVGGPTGDTGLTGRKIIVDTYGGYARHGGGAFSGKDPTKVDRSACYMARYAAKNVVAAGLARRCEIEVAYAIGVARPVSINANTEGTGLLPDERIAEIVGEVFDFRPAKIIEHLGLRRPLYAATSAYGHFGRTDVDLPWERVDRVDALKSYLK